MTDNEKIAVFHGERISMTYRGLTALKNASDLEAAKKNGWTPNLHYDTSWDQLMPVVEKIEKIKGIHTVISELGCDIYSFGKRVSDSREDTKIKTVYKAVVEFVKWHNSQK